MYERGFLLMSLLLLSADIAQPEEIELIYDDGSPDGVSNWAEGNIAAVRMTPPPGTWRVKEARYFLLSGGGEVKILGDQSGRPGEDLIEGVLVESAQMGWDDVDITPYSIIIEGEFYVGLESIDSMVIPLLGVDTEGNGRAWMYSSMFGSWSEQNDLTYFIRVVISDETGIEEEQLPESTISLHYDPNPFCRSTSISYTLPRACWVTVRIRDASGRGVRTLMDAGQTEGHHSIRWDGADDEGNPLPSGVYFTVIEFPGTTLVKKVVLIG